MIFHQLDELREANWPKYASVRLPEGWAGDWANVNTIQMYNDVIDWIHENIKRPRSNAHWVKIGDCTYVQIRKKRDWVWFTLRWGA